MPALVLRAHVLLYSCSCRETWAAAGGGPSAGMHDHNASILKTGAAQSAQDELAAIYISVAATDDSSLQTIYAHVTYHADDILWNHRFAQSCVEMDHLQALCFDKFQVTAPLPGCSDDDSRSSTSRHSSTSNLMAADAPARHAEAAYTARDRLEHVRTLTLSACSQGLRVEGRLRRPAVHAPTRERQRACAFYRLGYQV